ncbi:NAD-dependent epimerase/dehydratase [Penicillium concentricum]|uniref:NAD-dependent epimerase/dehydratase n=1 Tax=Penicillium concentricum TaxID=293559 RepID=A0A9W9RSE1_9EURO|nr:NAD-dependent epimerase/dehydratase [Penicillium concentricum]KAJ5365476.1 NAD-dependent epimerase/dehydratase [Penicillium concentricum]
MSNKLIFITGATGFIGSATAVEALKAGYRLRICLRKPSEQLQTLLSEYGDQIEFVIVPDLTDETAFDDKLNGVDYVLHLASPLPRGTDKAAYFPPAVKGTTAVLKAAAKVPTIKKVVITSSIAALIPMSGIPTGGVVKEDNDWDFSVDENGDFEDPQNPAVTAMRLYMASKLLADNATWEFRATAKPQYAVVTLHPAFVYGHNLVQNSADGVKTGSNSGLWDLIMKADATRNTVGVHVQDVAEAHIKALDPKIADGSKYLLAGPKTTAPEIARIVQRLYPDSGALISEDCQSASFPFDATKAETELGIQWRSFEAMVRDLMDQQLGFM